MPPNEPTSTNPDDCPNKLVVYTIAAQTRMSDQTVDLTPAEVSIMLTDAYDEGASCGLEPGGRLSSLYRLTRRSRLTGVITRAWLRRVTQDTSRKVGDGDA